MGGAAAPGRPGHRPRRPGRAKAGLVYTLTEAAKAKAVADVAAAAADRVLRVGPEAGLPLHYYPLDEAADAHAAVEGGAVGKVLIQL